MYHLAATRASSAIEKTTTKKFPCDPTLLKTTTLQEMRAVVAAAKSQEAFAAKDVAAIKAEIEQLEQRLTFNRSGGTGGTVVGGQAPSSERCAVPTFIASVL